MKTAWDTLKGTRLKGTRIEMILSVIRDNSLRVFRMRRSILYRVAQYGTTNSN